MFRSGELATGMQLPIQTGTDAMLHDRGRSPTAKGLLPWQPPHRNGGG